MSTVVCNLSYGPWEGGAWWEKIKDAATDFQQERPPGSIFLAMYPSLCRDMGMQPEGTHESHLQ
eukprot:7882935-Lingulodinium_polyedra.AAC.1